MTIELNHTIVHSKVRWAAAGEDGGRGLYWQGPDHHWLEIITRPYGSGD